MMIRLIMIILNKIYSCSFLLGFFILLSIPQFAQTKKSADDRFKEARELAFAGNRLAAIDSLESILVEDPDYSDVRVFMARVLAWNKQYDSSIKNLQIVLEKNNRKRSALITLIDVYTWIGEYETALEYCNKALDYYAPYPELLIKKAKLLKDLKRDDEAATVISQLLDLFPSNSEALSLESSLSDVAILNKATVQYGIDLFSVASPWHLAYGEYSRKVNFGTLIFRLSYGHRFSKSGVQIESDGYINIRSGTYVYANVGYSGSSIFPTFRFGIEPYQNLPSGFEVSLGLRYLDFTTSNATIFTGSLGKYISNFWLAYRFYYNSNSDRSSFSSILYIRRYLRDTDNYLTLRLGLGVVSYSEIENEQFSGLNSRGATLDFQLSIIPLLYFKGEITYANNEYYKGSYRNIYGFEVGIQKRF